VQRVAPAGEKLDFWFVSKFNTGILPLSGILPVMMTNYQQSTSLVEQKTINAAEYC